LIKKKRKRISLQVFIEQKRAILEKGGGGFSWRSVQMPQKTNHLPCASEDPKRISPALGTPHQTLKISARRNIKHLKFFPFHTAATSARIVVAITSTPIRSMT
jgi:hypothetical protein